MCMNVYYTHILSLFVHHDTHTHDYAYHIATYIMWICEYSVYWSLERGLEVIGVIQNAKFRIRLK